jgi:hypothetical protein
MKLSKKRLAQIIKEEYQRFQEEKGSDDQLKAEYEAAKQKLDKGPAVRRMSEEEHAEPVGAGIEDISDDDVVGTQPGLGFDVGSQEAFTKIFTKFRKRDGTLDYAEIMEVYEKLDEKNKKEFVEFILRNPLIFNMMKQSDVDFALDLDPDAPLDIDMSDYEQGAPESKEEEDMDSIVKDIQRLMKDPRSTS